MNIGIVCYPTYGGSGVIATELGKGLANKGHNVHFITYNRPARLDSFHANVFYHEVRVADYPLFEYAPYDTVLTSKMVDVVKNQNLDILHVHYAIPHAAVAYMARNILRDQGIYIPFVTTLHGTDITLVGQNEAFRPVVEFSINQSDGVTAVSESLKSDTLSNFSIKNEIEVIPNFIDFSRFKKSDKDHFKMAIAPNNEHILVHTSNFRPVKRVLDVIEMFRLVNQQIPSKLLMIGDGPDREKAELHCRKHGMCDQIRFLGKQDAVEELLSVADLFVMPSESESFGLAALEAMACSVPVVSSNAGGIPEVNIQGETGYLNNIGDVSKMAENALSILQDEEVHQQFRKNALARAQQFHINNILPLYEEYYSKIVENIKIPVA